MCGSGAVSCSCSLLIRGPILPAVRQKLHLSPCADSRNRLSRRMEMVKPELDEVGLLAAIDALKRVSPEQQEAAILELEEKHPGIGERARALLALEKQTAEAIERLEKQGREVEEPKVIEQKTVEPKKSGEIIALVDGRQVRFPRRGFGA